MQDFGERLVRALAGSHGLVGRSLLVGVVVGWWIPSGVARAQCSVGDQLGSCDTEIGYAGCCPTDNSIQWCEGDLLCGIDCSGNSGYEGCCTASSFPGCVDPTIEACVCAVDDYCCDIFFGAWDDLCVQIATEDCASCEDGGAPPIYCGWVEGEGFYDCRATAAPDPSGTSPMECGSASCAPSCGGKQCGPDGCGGSCGSCAAGSVCGIDGSCVASCTPQCMGRQCGSDGCGGICGQCTSVQVCTAAGRCEDESCQPRCDGRECGDDGCGGSCGLCHGAQTCSASGRCQDPVCQPQCDGRECGSDGCGGSCGACGDDRSCQAGVCASACSCEGRACGDDGCGRICGYCVAGSECNPATHQCDKTDGSGGAPGTPAENTDAQSCPAGQTWNAYAGACVVVDDGGAEAVNAGDEVSDSGCGSGSRVAWWGLVLLWLLGAGGRHRTLKS